jgi:hypothetical protein
LADEQAEKLISGLSEVELAGFDALRKCLWVICPTEESKNWDGTDMESAWKNDEGSRNSAAMLIDSLKLAGLTIVKSDQPYETPFKATPEDMERWEKAYQSDTANQSES